MADLSTEIANEFWWSKLGFWILVIGLGGEILVLRVPKSQETLEKILTLVFVVVIIVGVTLEHDADTTVAELISKQEMDAGVRIASLGKEAADANEHAKTLEAKAAQLALDLEKERANAQTRPLTESEFDAIASLKGKVTAVSIAYSNNCVECSIYCDQIVRALEAAKIDVKIFFRNPR